jgi:hypothetical protein
MEDIKNKILSNIKYASFYERYCETFNYHEGLAVNNVACPFHKDDTPSLSINIDNGLWFCHSCNMGGSIFDFYMKLKGCDFKQSLKDIAKEFGVDIKNYDKEKDNDDDLNDMKDEIERCNKDLLDNIDSSLDYVTKERGLTLDAINKFKIGYSTKTKRTTIPVYDDKNNLLNIRQHSRHKKEREAGLKVIGIKGFNSVRLYPLSALSQDVIFIMAGEFDMLLAQTLGIESALTKTGPEKQWYNKWNILFKGKNIIIIYDNDKAGVEGSILIANNLFSVAKSVKIIKLPVQEKGEDFTDYIIKYGHGIKDLFDLIAETPFFQIDDSSKISNSIADSEINEVSLEESSLDKYYFKRVKFTAICAGKDLNPFLVPKKIKLSCNMSKDKMCTFCKLLATKGELIIEYGENDPDILEYVSSSVTQKAGIIKKKSGIPICSSYIAEVLEAQNIEECYLTPSIDFKDDTFEDTYRKIFYLGQGLTLNDKYEFQGITVPDPRDQHSVVMINKISNSDTDIDSFTLNDEIKKQLKVFQPKEKTAESIKEKFEEKYNDLADNVIQIYERMDLMIAFDLVYHSALKFKFQNASIEKSHVECLIIGDTRTGKSVTAKRLIHHYRLGEIINCEKATIPGLIGGTFDLGSRKILTWGVIPRNDRRLVILDEADGIDTETISNLSGIRSSCIAERTIVGGTRKALARTRLIWIANPRGFKNLSEYTTGIEAVKVLIGKPEDIARFDFVIAVSQKDVSLDTINQKVMEPRPHIYTSNLCHTLLLFAWSRKEEDIIFSNEAIDLILKYATAFGKMFSSDIPIVHPNEQRIKIARLSVSTAISTFSINENDKVFIESYHVEFAINYLIELYSNPALSYTSYSKDRILDSSIDNEKEVIDKIKNGFSNRIGDGYNAVYFVNKMLSTAKIKFDDIMDSLQTGEREDVRQARQYLLINRCIKKEYTHWVVTEPFRFLLRRIQKELEK